MSSEQRRPRTRLMRFSIYILLCTSTATADVTVGGARATPACYSDAALSNAVHCRGHRCTVERAALDCWVGNTPWFTSSARVVPVYSGSDLIGFKIEAVRPRSLLARLGLRNGDLIKGIDGTEITSPEEALATYSKVRGHGEVDLQLERAGVATTLTYVLLPPSSARAFAPDLPLKPLPSAAEIAAGLTCDKRGCTVARVLVDRVFDHSLLSGLRLVETWADGELIGLQLSGVERDSFVARIGLRDGDILVAIDGKPILTPDHGFDYPETPGASHYSLDFLRNGRRTTLRYKVRQ